MVAVRRQQDLGGAVRGGDLLDERGVGLGVGERGDGDRDRHPRHARRLRGGPDGAPERLGREVVAASGADQGEPEQPGALLPGPGDGGGDVVRR